MFDLLKLPTFGQDYCPNTVRIAPWYYTVGILVVTHSYLYTIFRLLPPQITKRHVTVHLESSHPRHTTDPVITFLLLLPALLVQVAYPVLFTVSASACLQWGAAGYFCFIWMMRSLDLCFSWPDILEVDPTEEKSGVTIPFTMKYYLAHMFSHPDYAHLASFHEKHCLDAVWSEGPANQSGEIVKSSALENKSAPTSPTSPKVKRRFSVRPSRSYSIPLTSALYDMSILILPRILMAEFLFHFYIPPHEKLLQTVEASWTTIPYLNLPFNAALHNYSGIQAMVFFLFQGALADMIFYATGVFGFGMKVKTFHPRHRITHHHRKRSSQGQNAMKKSNESLAPKRNTHFVALVYDLVDIMFYPLTATSVKDFWAEKWNAVFQNVFRNVIFGRLLHMATPPSKKQADATMTPKMDRNDASVARPEEKSKEEGRPLPAEPVKKAYSPKEKRYFYTVSALASCLVFFVSGMFHEIIHYSTLRGLSEWNDCSNAGQNEPWYALFSSYDYVNVPRAYPHLWETLSFFLVHGLLSLAQTFLQKLVPPLRHGTGFWLTDVACNLAVLYLTLPLYFGGNLMSDFWIKMSFARRR